MSGVCQVLWERTREPPFGQGRRTFGVAKVFGKQRNLPIPLSADSFADDTLASEGAAQTKVAGYIHVISPNCPAR